jgi:Cu/Ag efflux protein CusF
VLDPLPPTDRLGPHKENTMKRILCAAVATVALAWPCATIAFGQSQAVSKTITGEKKTATATIEAIDHQARTVTLKEENGEYSEVTVPADVKRFDTLKVGDKITATYYENLVLRLKLPGEKATDTASGAMTPGTGAKAGVTAATQRTITATITAIDMKVPSITFTGPNGWKYSSRVQDMDALKKVKVGDRVEMTWTTAVLISIK